MSERTLQRREDLPAMTRFIRPNIAAMDGYTPGEQPQAGGFIKLNTNENPYPPSPRVKAALGEAITDRLRLYPDPTAKELRRAIALLHGIEAEMVLVGNGSDDLLTIITRGFVGPGDHAAFATPSYLLYSTLVALQDGRSVIVPYSAGWTLDLRAFAVPGLKLCYLANPDSPVGTALARDEIARLAGLLDCPLVVDEAYVDFAEPSYHALPLVKDHANLIVTRSFSKGYSLAGIRLGYLVAGAEIVEQLAKLKDSYNCDALSQVAGVAGLTDQAYLAETRSRIQATRSRLTAALRALGFTVPDSQSNFVWATGGPPARPMFQALKDRKILVRYMSYEGYPDGLRISVGTDAEIDRLLAVMCEVAQLVEA
jgi:histidinol-phosphate aminotransferase